jgi:molybdopterin/thiamine biosynthesis adenylyltransferase
MEVLHRYLRSHSEEDLLPWSVQEEAAKRFGLTHGAIEKAALELNLMPARYQRNRETISIKQQLQLFDSKVAVIGCGGLGGYAVEELTRLGIGQITVIDPDVFEEHNLNRQVLSTIEELGNPKVKVAAERMGNINPAVTIIPIMKALTKDNAPELLENIDVVVDALDSIPSRLELSESCNRLNIPLVHGSIAGWYGQVLVQFPGENSLQKIYGRCTGRTGIEIKLGNPSFTPGVVASLEATEVCKILLDEGTPLRNRMLSINLLDMEFNEILI